MLSPTGRPRRKTRQDLKVAAVVPMIVAAGRRLRCDPVPPTRSTNMNELAYRLQAAWHSWEQRDKGATAVEYALMVALLAMVIVGAVTALGNSLQAELTSINDTFPAPTPTP
jgi:pilus assembly protein Flp/PilA